MSWRGKGAQAQKSNNRKMTEHSHFFSISFSHFYPFMLGFKSSDILNELLLFIIFLFRLEEILL